MHMCTWSGIKWPALLPLGEAPEYLLLGLPVLIANTFSNC